MARRKARKSKGTRETTSGPSTSKLLRRSLSSYLKALPALAVVGLAGAIPLQLLLTWLMERQGIAGDALWEMRYQGLADWVVGSLIAAALYRTIHRSVAGEPAKGRRLISTLGWAYRGALGVWLGMFMTRMMVSFAVMIPSLPLLGGLFLVNREHPELMALVMEPESVSEVEPAMFLWLLLLTPLVAPPLFFYLRYQLADAVVSLERIDGFGAMQRSKALTEGVKWKLLWALAALGLPVEIVWLLFSSAGGSIDPWLAAAANAIYVVLAALPGTFLVHVFLLQGAEAVERREVAGAASE